MIGKNKIFNALLAFSSYISDREQLVDSLFLSLHYYFNKMVQVINIKPMPGFKLEVKFNDGIEGVVDLSNLKDGEAFKCWNEKGIFEKAHIEGDAIVWNDALDIDVLNLYLNITGLTFEQFANKQKNHA